MCQWEGASWQRDGLEAWVKSESFIPAPIRNNTSAAKAD